jgi:pSer/pThr/pTyr-binding forkhead associated (FHA) protein
MGAGAAIALIVVIAIVVGMVRRRRRARALQAPLPLIPFSANRGAPSPPRPDSAWRGAAADFEAPNATTPVWTPPVASPPPTDAGRSIYAPPATPTGSGSVERASTFGSAASAYNPLAATAIPNDAVAGAAIDGASVRYWRPADGTLQFLPGRLEVIAGRDAGQEIRFVRTPGPDGTRVTFGRAEGAPYRHVQLREPTVSRAHARMTLELGGVADDRDGRSAGSGWRLENLSATNPVVVNGRPLAADGGDGCSVVLREGDRIEMGEVVFRFHVK